MAAPLCQAAVGVWVWAITFLIWLYGRGRTLAACRRADVDAWYAASYTAHRLTHALLRWAMTNKRTSRLTIPRQYTGALAKSRFPRSVPVPERVVTLYAD